ncbi:MAG: 30S ribosomal protein S27e [Candidatus ainarchaeum sp.]|nr:30S ribosomal protein S27e [Candidatus ainarchaeum sp.]
MSGKFLKVKCPSCGNINIIYSATTASIYCSSCKTEIAEPSGGSANIIGEIVLDN